MRLSPQSYTRIGKPLSAVGLVFAVVVHFLALSGAAISFWVGFLLFVVSFATIMLLVWRFNPDSRGKSGGQIYLDELFPLYRTKGMKWALRLFQLYFFGLLVMAFIGEDHWFFAGMSAGVIMFTANGLIIFHLYGSGEMPHELGEA